ncbi:MAG: flagellar biosynthesis protein FlgA, partial [Betaproteobacteria bacterium]
MKTGLNSCLAAALCVAAAAHAEPAPAAADGDLAQQVQRFAGAATHAGMAGMRVSVEVGALDPRLKLAPCERIEPYLPAGTRLWGKAHIGVRCLSGPTRWNVYLPVTVHVWGRALVAASPLAAGTNLAAADLVEAEVDLAAGRGRVFGAAQ